MKNTKYYIVLFFLNITSLSWAGSWIDCADEGDFCNFKGEKRVAYGNKDKWTYKKYSDGVACSYKKFTPGKYVPLEDFDRPLAQCKYFNPWGLCAYEGKHCKFEGSAKVAFGADSGGWIVKTFSGGVHCSSQEFGQVNFNLTKVNKCLLLGPKRYFVDQ